MLDEIETNQSLFVSTHETSGDQTTAINIGNEITGVRVQRVFGREFA